MASGLIFPNDWNVDWENLHTTHPQYFQSGGIDWFSSDNNFIKPFIDAINERIVAINFYVMPSGAEDNYIKARGSPANSVYLSQNSAPALSKMGYPKQGDYPLSCSIWSQDYNFNFSGYSPLLEGLVFGDTSGEFFKGVIDKSYPNVNSLFLNPYAYKEYFQEVFSPSGYESTSFPFTNPNFITSNKQGTWDVGKFAYPPLSILQEGYRTNYYFVDNGPCNLIGMRTEPDFLGANQNTIYNINYIASKKFSMDCISSVPVYFKNIKGINYDTSVSGLYTSGCIYPTYYVPENEYFGLNWAHLQAKAVSLAKFYLKKFDDDGHLIDYANMKCTFVSGVSQIWEQNDPSASGFASHTPNLYNGTGATSSFVDDPVGDINNCSNTIIPYNTMLYNGSGDYYRPYYGGFFEDAPYTGNYVGNSGIYAFAKGYSEASILNQGPYHFPSGFPITDYGTKAVHRLLDNFPNRNSTVHVPGFRRKLPREIWSSGNYGENGWIARLVGMKLNASGTLDRHFEGAISGYGYEARPNWVADQEDHYYLKNVGTPQEELMNCGRIFSYSSGVGWVKSANQNLNPDVLDRMGLIQPGDYFGPWILNDLKDAINLLSWTWGMNDFEFFSSRINTAGKLPPGFIDFSLSAETLINGLGIPYRFTTYPTFRLTPSFIDSVGTYKNNIKIGEGPFFLNAYFNGGTISNQLCGSGYIFDRPAADRDYVGYSDCVYASLSGQLECLPFAFSSATSGGSSAGVGHNLYEYFRSYCYIRPTGVNPEANLNDAINIDIYTLTDVFLHPTYNFADNIYNSAYDLFGDPGGTKTPADENSGDVNPSGAGIIDQFSLISSNKIGTIIVDALEVDANGNFPYSACLLVGDENLTKPDAPDHPDKYRGYKTVMIYGIARWPFNYVNPDWEIPFDV